MTGEVDQISNVTGDVTESSSHSDAGTKSEVTSSTYYSTMFDQAIANKAVPLLYQYWKAPMVTDKDISAYHAASWLPGVLLYFPATMDFPMINRTNIVYFESHLMCGLGLLPSKFIVSILIYIGCELVHRHLDFISVLSCFNMLCECWLGIPPYTSLFWYFYSPSHYECKVFCDVGLTLCHNHREEYLKVTFRGCWKGSS
jgi:hypothetical protein